MELGDDTTQESLAHRVEKRAVISAAAVAEFSSRGFDGTSMANIARAAGMSRPALYQYFKNKNDIFMSSFVGLLDDHVDAALGALTKAGISGSAAELSGCLDGFLQRFDGDLWERMAASPHSEALLSAKQAKFGAILPEVFARLWSGLDDYLLVLVPGSDARAVAMRVGWAEILRLSPKGFKTDQPSVEVFRSRLSTLARTTAADITAFDPKRDT